jgi:murein DD-endopeptidase MepM/ murein hydrolase activator NlpD
MAPFVLVGDGPVAQMITTSTASSTGSQANVLAALRTKLDRAMSGLRSAESALEAAKSTQVVARAVAERLDERAAQARSAAETAAGVYLDAVEGDGAAMSSMSAAFSAGNDLLAGLGGMERVQKLAGDSSRLREIAELRDVEADGAEERAAAAWAAVDAIPIAELENAVTEAKGTVTAARAEFNGARTRLAAEEVAVFDNLPSDSGQLSERGWASPVAGSISDGYGPRPVKPIAGVNEFHRGTDVASQCGTAVFAATDGVVVSAGPNGSYGNWILVDHGSGVATGYAHLRAGGILVAEGQQVAAGTLIGAVGSTGASTGCHLHFEVRINGTAVDAVPFMAARGVQLG